jgi:transitional endoplasmic reticulum ATPase
LASSEIRGSPITFIAVDATQVLSKYFGQSSRNLARIFQEARQAAPCILFFDQIDSLIGKREGSGADDHSNRLVTTFLVEMDGVVAKRAAGSKGEDAKQIIVVGATRAKHLIDPAMLRPGRLELHIRVPLPDSRSRGSFLRSFCARSPSFKLDNDDFEEIVKATESWSMADLESLCGEAVLLALRNDLDAEAVCISHFREILAKQ